MREGFLGSLLLHRIVSLHFPYFPQLFKDQRINYDLRRSPMKPDFESQITPTWHLRKYKITRTDKEYQVGDQSQLGPRVGVRSNCKYRHGLWHLIHCFLLFAYSSWLKVHLHLCCSAKEGCWDGAYSNFQIFKLLLRQHSFVHKKYAYQLISWQWKDKNERTYGSFCQGVSIAVTKSQIICAFFDVCWPRLDRDLFNVWLIGFRQGSMLGTFGELSQLSPQHQMRTSWKMSWWSLIESLPAVVFCWYFRRRRDKLLAIAPRLAFQWNQ